MWKSLLTAARMLLILSVITGMAYPLAVTGLAQLLFQDQANGSLIVEDGVVRGSGLIGQPFDDPRYFWSRPSATARMPYDASASSGSNLGPTNPALTLLLAERVARLRAHPGGDQPIPVDLVTSSGSGLDPHISPAAARFQIPRVALARGVDVQRVRELVERHVEGRVFGVLGEPRVSVLHLNRALDRLP
jgi:K+-transporting ATPase ATPase C chain